VSGEQVLDHLEQRGMPAVSREQTGDSLSRNLAGPGV
jgi:hypothetical protein